jgi:hypothetical protein
MANTLTDHQLKVTLWGLEYEAHPHYQQDWVNAIEKENRDVGSVRVDLVSRVEYLLREQTRDKSLSEKSLSQGEHKPWHKKGW